MTHPNTVAHSAGAVCCLSERDARRSDRCGWRATWWDGFRVVHATPRNLHLMRPTRRWTR